MARKLIFDRHVPEDLADALDYYESISVELANRFRRSVNDRLDDVAQRPESFPIDQAPVRFARVERFPYLIFFVPKPSHVSVLAIVHSASEPGKWRERST